MISFAALNMKLTQNQQDLLPMVNPTDLLCEYCKGLNDWATSWQIVKADIASGQDITNEFKLFLLDRIKKRQAKRTIKNHASYLWALGGELIRNLNENKNERKLSARKFILKYIDDSGGPYWRHAYDDADHDRYDSVCRQLFKFLTKNSD